MDETQAMAVARATAANAKNLGGAEALTGELSDLSAVEKKSHFNVEQGKIAMKAATTGGEAEMTKDLRAKVAKFWSGRIFVLTIYLHLTLF